MRRLQPNWRRRATSVDGPVVKANPVLLDMCVSVVKTAIDKLETNSSRSKTSLRQSLFLV